MAPTEGGGALVAPSHFRRSATTNPVAHIPCGSWRRWRCRLRAAKVVPIRPANGLCDGHLPMPEES
jgi:hypothetical protein